MFFEKELTICQRCGCGFGLLQAVINPLSKPATASCPCCKTEHELPQTIANKDNNVKTIFEKFDEKFPYEKDAFDFIKSEVETMLQEITKSESNDYFVVTDLTSNTYIKVKNIIKIAAKYGFEVK